MMTDHTVPGSYHLADSGQIPFEIFRSNQRSRLGEVRIGWESVLLRQPFYHFLPLLSMKFLIPLHISSIMAQNVNFV
jgi:hypothetical protein